MQGPGSVHLSGYFEPKGDDMDDDMFYGDEADEEGESDMDEEEQTPVPAKKSASAVDASLKAAKVNSVKNETNAMLA